MRDNKFCHFFYFIVSGHVFWCGTHQEVVNMVTALRQICQISYQRQQVLEETASEVREGESVCMCLYVMLYPC